MQPHMPIWTQRLPADIRRRLELAVAAAVEARSDTHARQALNLVGVLAPRMPFDEAVERYIDIMSLAGEEAETVRNRSLVALSDTELVADLSRERHRTGWGLNWRYATPLGAVRFVRRQLRRNAEEDLWMELSAARAEEAIIRTHIKHSLIFVQMLGEIAPPPRAVTLYLDQLEVPSMRARQIYQRVLARVAEQELPRLLAAQSEASPAPPEHSRKSAREPGRS